MAEMGLPFDLDTFKRLIDHAYDGIAIWNRNRDLIYINNASFRRYGAWPEEMIGLGIDHFTTGDTPFWDSSTSPRVFEEKKPVMQKYRSLSGLDVWMISVPVFDENGDVEYVIQTSRDDDQELMQQVSSITQTLPESNDSDSSDDKAQFVYKSKEFDEMLKDAARISLTDSPCLILGGTGTGKNMVANYIHRISPRKSKPFVYLNIASLNPSLIESQLFGYCKGAFSGARSDGSQGLFQAAHGGTLFLDEIGEMPLDLQAKILHVIQYGEFLPVGGVKTEHVDVRILSATNCSLYDMVESGRFRKDLYHRLSVFEISIPPLRQRPDDLELLITYFINQYNKKYKKICTLSKETRNILMSYSYGGNVRELSNIIERCVLNSKESEITPNVLPKNMFTIVSQEQKRHQSTYTFNGSSYEEAKRAFEEQFIRSAYQKHPSSRQLAKHLNISQTKANRLIQKYIVKDS